MFDAFNLIDLTHTLHAHVPTWSGSCGFCSEIKVDYDEGIRVMKYKMHGGIGTHIDAPSHFIEHGLSVADIPLQDLMVPLIVIDMTAKMQDDLWVEVGDIQAFEALHGAIAPRSLVVVSTGWEKFWNDSSKYRNLKEDGLMHFPGYSKKAAEYLIAKGVIGIGMDSLSPDGSNNTDYPVHHAVLGAGKYILENLCNLHHLKPKGCYCITLPLKIQDGSESAVRSVALVPK